MPDFKVSYYSENSFDREVSKVYWVDTHGHYFLVTDKYNNFKAKLEAYDRFLKLLDTANPSFGDPGNIIIRYNGELYSTEKWNVEATDVNSEDYAATKRLHLTLRCVD